MAISDRLNKLTTDITNAYTSIENKCGTIPSNKNTNNLSTAIDSIEVIETATAEGESLSLTNTKAMPYSDYVVKGKSEQEISTQSANLFDEEKYKNATYTTSTYKYTSTNIKGGRTLYFRAQLKSGATAISGLYLCISTDGANPNNGLSRFAISNGTITGGSTNFTAYTGTLAFSFYPTNKSVSDIFNAYNLWVSTDDINYVPFTPDSPSPDYPSEIHSVADDVNLFDKNLFQSFTASLKNIELILKPNTNYTMSSNITKSSLGNANLFIYKTGESPSTGSNGIYVGLPRTVTTGNDGKVIITYRDDTLEYNDPANDFWYKLQKGSTATPYSPYNQGTVTIKQRGKNKYSGGDKTFTKYENFSVETIPAGTYNFIGNVVSDDTDSNQCLVNFYKDNTQIGYKYLNRGDFNTQITLNDICNKIYLYASNTANNAEGDTATYSNIMISNEEGNYEPYRANDYTIQTEPLRSLPNGVKDSKDTKQHTRVGVKVFDGSVDENWQNFTTVSGNIVQAMIPILNFGSRVALSDLFPTTTDYSATEHIVVGSTLTSLYVHIDKTRLNTEDITGFKTWLSNNPLTVQYELATEIIEPLTQNQATTMLDIIKTGSYEGTTNIYTDEDVKPTIKVDYYKKK